MRQFFPELQPYTRGRLRVSELHEIYYEECGNPKGKPVVVLHGGPGGGISPFLRRLHDPKLYRIILFDQRGCGQSTPHAELRENTTWHLVADIEALRAHLGIETWQVLGGSWGSTLALAYAQSHVERVTELILRGIFAIRKREIDWFYQEGASMLFPDVWETYLAPIPVPEREDLVAAYYRRLTGTDSHEQMACAKAWSQWEASTLSLRPNPQLISEFGGDAFALAFARIECHYFVNKGFFDRDGQLLADAPKLRAIPGVIIQGRYDVVTPMDTAWSLHRAWPEAAFEIIPDAGHTATEPGITDALIRATDRFAMRAPHS
ncbi:MAG TPA: prolyl aminopeptidase [Aestuariivirga sp.]|nr:prolyl aminopeptidase [Aestuariivirga sp.]